ncbi:hypothetical protein Dvar_22530 [Desulfosarcina variabilis str. Montpellier]|uniref:phage baseplate assembly protein V n=1 Tax=Desulfosarcina variabilis TaxID=2300 RepID=UPI003AFABB44
MTGEKRYGKYRGMVQDNADTDKRGRIKVSVPTVMGDGGSNWALPCVPYAGDGVGFFAIPPVGANVWVEFEGGDPGRPIWTGCFWDGDQTPVGSDYTVDKKVLKTEAGIITIDEGSDSAGITIVTRDGSGNDKMKIIVNNDGIEIDNGQGASIKLENGKVSINGTALEVE